MQSLRQMKRPEYKDMVIKQISEEEERRKCLLYRINQLDQEIFNLKMPVHPIGCNQQLILLIENMTDKDLQTLIGGDSMKIEAKVVTTNG